MQLQNIFMADFSFIKEMSGQEEQVID